MVAICGLHESGRCVHVWGVQAPLGEDGSDCEQGLAYFKRAAGMQPSSAACKAIEILERKAFGHATSEDRNFIRVLFENGIASEKEEIRKEIIIPYRYPIHAGISVPKLVHRGGAHERLSLWDGSNTLDATEMICDFERVVAKEFAEEFKAVIVRIGIQIALMEVERAQLDRLVKDGKMSPFARDLTMAASGAEEEMVGALQEETGAADVTVRPDISLSGKIIGTQHEYDSKTQQLEYYLQLTLTDLKTGLSIWEGETPVVKRGSSRTVSW